MTRHAVPLLLNYSHTNTEIQGMNEISLQEVWRPRYYDVSDDMNMTPNQRRELERRRERTREESRMDSEILGILRAIGPLQRHCRAMSTGTYGREELLHMCTECIHEITAYSRRDTDIHEVYTRLKNIIQPTYLMFRYREDTMVKDWLVETHNILWADESRRAMVTILDYFQGSEEFHRMNKRTYQYQKCVMTLPSQLLPLWNTLLLSDQSSLCDKMRERLGLRRGELGLHEAPRAPCPVIFYISEPLHKLAAETFRQFQNQTPFQQALYHLLFPHPEYRAFTAKAYDLYEERGDPRLMTPLGLPTLLTQLRFRNHSVRELQLTH